MLYGTLYKDSHFHILAKKFYPQGQFVLSRSFHPLENHVPCQEPWSATTKTTSTTMAFQETAVAAVVMWT